MPRRMLLVLMIAFATGCAGQERQPPVATAPPVGETQAPTPPSAVPPVAAVPAAPDRTGSPRPDPATDPRGYLRWVRAQYARMEQYTLTFERTERRGLGFFKSMRGPEEIRCWYRREPFSIRMEWVDPEIKYGASSYVRGQFNDRVRFIPRHGLFGLPPTLTRVSLQTPVTWGEARYPVSDFGFERAVEKSLDVIRRAGDRGRLTYVGREAIPGLDARAHVLRIEVPAEFSDTPRAELLFHEQTDLLVVNRLFNGHGQPEATYRYRDVNPQVALHDADFLLDGETLESEVAAGSGPADEDS